MPRYIDAEKIEYKTMLFPVLDGMLVKTKKIDNIVEMQDIDAIPTADVQEVKRGKWLEETERIKSIAMMPTNITYYRCSECGRREYKKEPYCNCGARMETD